MSEAEMIADLLQIKVIEEQQAALNLQEPSPPAAEQALANAAVFAGEIDPAAPPPGAVFTPAPGPQEERQAEGEVVALLFAHQLAAHGTLRQVEEDRKRRHKQEKENPEDA